MKTVQWDPSTIFLSDISTDLREYQRDVSRTGTAFSSGQLKLTIGDMLFLINHTAGEEQIKLVVAGSVTGEHFALDLQMFPMIQKIDFWDPKPDLAILRHGKPPATLPHQTVEFFTNTIDVPDGGYLTPSRAYEMYATEKNVYFISDLRTVGPNEYEDQWRRERDGITTVCRFTRQKAERLLSDSRLHATERQKIDIESQFADPDATMYLTDLTIEQKLALDAEYNQKLNNEERKELDMDYELELWTKDSNLQLEILKAMNPVQAMLKFRLPYYHDHIAVALGGEVEYLDGYIYKQAFNGPHSTETRLVPIRDPKTREWKTRRYNLLDYERKLFYHNTVLRDDAITPKLWLNSINRSSAVPDIEEGLINSYDTCYLFYVLGRYLEFTGDASPVSDEKLDQVLALWFWMRDTLNKYLTNPLNMKAAREKVLANARKKGATSTTTSVKGVQPDEPVLSSIEILRRRKQQAALESRDTKTVQGIKVAPLRVPSPITFVNIQQTLPDVK